jgi:hypothetical protein
MDALRRASAFLFYAFGLIVLVLLLLLRSDVGGGWAQPLLNVLDLPLLLFACVYGGLSLVTSMTKNKPSTILTAGVGVILGILFLVFLWFNFGFQFAEPL